MSTFVIVHNLSCSCATVDPVPCKAKETVDPEEPDERDEDNDDDQEVVPVEAESYVNLRKTMVKRHEVKTENVLQENGKLCREFKRKQVKDGCLGC